VVKRRSLDDALTPEEQAFLDTGKPKSIAKKKQPAKPKEKPAMKTSAALKESPPSAPAPQPASVDYALNTRLAAHLSNALLRASTDRKVQRLSSATQRDIVEEAMADWLKKHGYLN